MDQAFLSRAQRLLDRKEVARLDHDVLVAAICAQQAASATARVQADIAHPSVPRSEEPLVELLLGGPSWRDAALRQSGCFSRPAPGQSGKGPST
jgi:hypothetical protein